MDNSNSMIRDLISVNSYPQVTVFFQFENEPDKRKKCELRFRNLKRQLESQLKLKSIESWESLVESAQDFFDIGMDKNYSSGVFFISKTYTKPLFNLDLDLKEDCFVGSTFYIRPIVKQLSVPEFLVFNISQREVKSYHWSLKNLDQLPLDFSEETEWFEKKMQDFQKSRQQHGSRNYPNNTSIRHGQGGIKDHHDKALHEYLKKVESRISRYAKQVNLPLAICSTEPVLSQYKDLNHYSNTYYFEKEAGTRQAIRNLEPQIKETVLNSYVERMKKLANKKGLKPYSDSRSDQKSLFEKSKHGLIENLYLNPNTNCWGEFRENNKIVFHSKKSNNSEDIYNKTIVETLRFGGKVVPLKQVEQGSTLAMERVSS